MLGEIYFALSLAVPAMLGATTSSYQASSANLKTPSIVCRQSTSLTRQGAAGNSPVLDGPDPTPPPLPLAYPRTLRADGPDPTPSPVPLVQTRVVVADGPDPTPSPVPLLV
jgi:hypothetical protein